jgi:glutamine---fructose-6-phosphate transaminase (isomerizing)
MCGIIGYTGFSDPKDILLDGLKRLEYRGYDSAGIAVFSKKGAEIFRCEGRIQNLESKLSGQHFDGFTGIGHTRWATHGAPTEINAHPHKVGAITLVHNGIIENYSDHKEAILAMGREVTSETDSEIVAHLLDLEVSRGRSLEAGILNVLPRLKGSYAFVIVSDHEPDTIVGIRNGAPLLVGLGEKESFLASDVQAILHRTKKIIYLEDHQFAVCRKEKVIVKSEAGDVLIPVVKTIEWTPDQMDKSGYRHYMLKEIHEQPQAIANTIEGNINHHDGVVSLSELTPSIQTLKHTERIYIVACGTARHAGLIGQYYIERFSGIPVQIDFASEFRYRNPVMDKGTLLVLISQSGETADTLAALREGKSRGIKTLSICNVRDSTLARESDIVLYTNAGPEIGVASTKAFTTQCVVLYMLAVELGMARNHLAKGEAETLTQNLIRLPLLVDQTLQLESKIESLAAELQTQPFFFYMGRGVNYPVALEGALKLKEISYIHAEGYPAGELKHGPIALVDREAVVIVLCPSVSTDPLYEKSMSNLQEVKARGGKLLCVGTKGDDRITRESKFFVEIPESTWGLNPIILSIPMQIFAYYVALLRGTDVDKPRNLAKSVTVE